MTLRPISHEGQGPYAAELRSLEAERDPELKAEGIYHLASRAETRGDYAVAVELYHRLEGGPVADRAARRLRTLEGEGSFGDRTEYLLRNFTREATDPTMLFAMGTAGALFQATRFLTLGRLAAAPASAFTRGFVARSLASLAGFAVEAPAFPLAGRLAHAALGHSQDWSAVALRRELASSVLVLGGMKLGGLASTSLARGVAGGARLSPLLQGAFQQSGMLGGILLGHRFEQAAGLSRASSASSTLIDSLAMLLQFNVAGRLTQAAFGEGFGRWEREIEVQTQRIGTEPRRPWSDLLPNATQLSPAFAMAGGREPARRPETIGPQVMMMKGLDRNSSSGSALPSKLEISLVHLRHPDSQLAKSHLAYLETVLRAGGEGLGAREYVELYDRLIIETEHMDEGVSREVFSVLGEVLTQAPLDKPGPRLLFNEMIHIDRFADRTVGNALLDWLRNPTLQSKHRQRILRLVREIFQQDVNATQKKPSDSSEEALLLLNNYGHRLSVEGRPFRRAVDAALDFLHYRDVWFHQRFAGTNFGQVILLDPKLSTRNRDRMFNLMENGLRNTAISSANRVKAMQGLEDLARRQDLPEPVRDHLEGRLPLWRAEFLALNVQRTKRSRSEWNHFSELAYLMTQDYTPAMNKREFGRALQRFIFDAKPDSPGYAMMVHDALRYVEEPNLTPEFRQTFAIQILKALSDSTEAQIPPLQRDVHRQNQEYLVERISALPQEERSRLALHLIEELGRHDGRAERASVVIGSLASLIVPTDEIRSRLSDAAEQSFSPQARNVAQLILQNWQRLN